MKKPFTTTIDESLQSTFKSVCAEKDVKMNEVIEAFMESFIQGNFHIEKEIKYKVIPTSKVSK